jgi:hypothetical protein
MSLWSSISGTYIGEGRLSWHLPTWHDRRNSMTMYSFGKRDLPLFPQHNRSSGIPYIRETQFSCHLDLPDISP